MSQKVTLKSNRKADTPKLRRSYTKIFTPSQGRGENCKVTP